MNELTKIACPYCDGKGYKEFTTAELSSIFIKNKNRSVNVNSMIALRKKGFTYDEIGEIFGITRQRVHQLINNK